MWQPAMIKKKKKKKLNKLLLGRCQNVGLPGVAGVWVEDSGMEIAVQTAGKAPVNSGTVTAGLPDGRTAVVATVVVGMTLSDGPFGSTLQHICLVLFVAQKMGNKLDPFSREVLGEQRTWGKRFCQNAMSAWHDCGNDMYPTPCSFGSRGLNLYSTVVNGRKHFDIRVIAHIVTQGHNGAYWPTVQINISKHKVTLSCYWTEGRFKG